MARRRLDTTVADEAIIGDGPEDEDETAEQLKLAVSELLRQLVALDWALVCRSRVATLLSQLHEARSLASGSGGAGGGGGGGRGGVGHRRVFGHSLDGRQALVQGGVSASFTIRKPRSPSDTAGTAREGTGSRLGSPGSSGAAGMAAATAAGSALRVAELQGEILLWCAALVWADR